MLPYIHLIVGLIASIGLYFIFPEIGIIELGLFLSSSVLIDFDHYLFYIFDKKGFNLKKAYRLGLREKKKRMSLPKKEIPFRLIIFHGFEWVILFLVLGVFISRYFYFVAFGMFLHLIVDLIETLKYGYDFEKISIIHDFLKYKKLK